MHRNYTASSMQKKAVLVLAGSLLFCITFSKKSAARRTVQIPYPHDLCDPELIRLEGKLKQETSASTIIKITVKLVYLKGWRQTSNTFLFGPISGAEPAKNSESHTCNARESGFSIPKASQNRVSRCSSICNLETSFGMRAHSCTLQ